MVFKCQEDSFLKKFTTKVVSCEKNKFDWNGTQVEGFKLILDNTILFPEGGGQPCDYGTIDGKPVRNVLREGALAIHYVETDEQFEVGAQIEEEIDWERRLDHMQQHSGQHLITALFDREFGYDTKSWWLGSESSYIELNAKDVSNDQIDQIEKLANELIIEAKPVTVNITSVEEGIKFQDIRAPRGLPADHVGPVRVVTIHDIESNMCCGTHVSNLSQLQAIKLLHVEKAKSKLYLHFIVGKRILKKLKECYSREIQLNNILKGGPPNHINLVEKLQAHSKLMTKNFQKLLKEVAIYEANKLKTLDPLPKYYSLHRRDGIEPDFINTFLRNAPDNIFYFLTVADNIGKGHMMLRGDPEDIKFLGNALTELLDGKGNGKSNIYQAKVNNINKLKQCEEKICEYFINKY